MEWLVSAQSDTIISIVVAVLFGLSVVLYFNQAGQVSHTSGITYRPISGNLGIVVDP
jgi:hypothetical protein